MYPRLYSEKVHAVRGAQHRNLAQQPTLVLKNYGALPKPEVNHAKSEQVAQEKEKS